MFELDYLKLIYVSFFNHMIFGKWKIWRNSSSRG